MDGHARTAVAVLCAEAGRAVDEARGALVPAAALDLSSGHIRRSECFGRPRRDFRRHHRESASTEGPAIPGSGCRAALVWRVMADFDVPRDLTFNRGPIADPEAFAREASAASWLFLC